MIVSLKYYIITTANTSDKRRELIKLFADCVSEEHKGEIMNIAQQFEDDGIKKGEKIGIEKERLFIINNMLENNMSINTISKATKLSTIKIEKFLEKNKR